MNLAATQQALETYRWPFQRHAERGAQWVAVFMAIALVLPTAWLSISEVLLLFLWIASGRYGLKLARIRANPVALAAIGLFCLLLVGTIYSRVTWSESFDTVDNYLALLFMPIVISVFDRAIWRDRAYLALIAGVLIIATVAYLRWSGLLPPANGVRMAFKNHITEGIMLSFGCFLLAHRALAEPKSRKWWLVALVLIVPLLFFLYGGKTGYVVFFCLCLLYVWQALGLRALLPALILMLGAMTLLWLSSGVFQDRVTDAMSGLVNYQPGKAADSVGVRLEYYKNTLLLIKENPLTGVGTGGFASGYREIVRGMDLPPVLVTENPHNEYLLLAAQLGIGGALLFVLLLAVQWAKSFDLSPESRYVAQGLVIAMGIGCLFNSLLLDFTDGAWFGLVAGIAFSDLRTNDG